MPKVPLAVTLPPLIVTVPAEMPYSPLAYTLPPLIVTSQLETKMPEEVLLSPRPLTSSSPVPRI